MFENTQDGVDKGRSRMIMIVAAVVVVLAAGAFALLGSLGPSEAEQAPVQQGLPNARRAGDPEFDKHKGLVSLMNKKFFTQANMLGQTQALATGEIMNFTDRTITGIELRGKAIGKDGEVKATALATPVPKIFPKVSPGNSVKFTVTIDGTPPPDQLDDITVDVEGLVFEE